MSAVLTNEIQSSGAISTPTASAIAATVSALASSSSANFSSLNFLSTSLTLLPRGNGAPGPDETTQKFLRDLARAAQTASESLACGSLLAGQGSESDDFADVSVWLGEGEFGAGKEREVLKVLGLDGDAKSVELRPPHMLPPTIASSSITSSGKDLEEVVDALNHLEQRYCFLVNLPGAGQPLTLYILLGYLNPKGGVMPGWAGLVGLGVWSDE